MLHADTGDWSICISICGQIVIVLIASDGTFKAAYASAWVRAIFMVLCRSKQLNSKSDQMTQWGFFLQFFPLHCHARSHSRFELPALVAHFSTVANYFCAAVNLRSQFKIIDNASGVVVCSLSADAAPELWAHWESDAICLRFLLLHCPARRNSV